MFLSVSLDLVFNMQAGLFLRPLVLDKIYMHKLNVIYNYTQII